jgi:hypothetical protein
MLYFNLEDSQFLNAFGWSHTTQLVNIAAILNSVGMYSSSKVNDYNSVYSVLPLEEPKEIKWLEPYIVVAEQCSCDTKTTKSFSTIKNDVESEPPAETKWLPNYIPVGEMCSNIVAWNHRKGFEGFKLDVNNFI